MSIKNYTRYLISIILLMFFLCPSAQAKFASGVIPEDAVCLILVKVKKDDQGIQWVLDSYKRWILKEKVGPDANKVIKDFNILEFDEIAMGLIHRGQAKPSYLVVGDMNDSNASITFKYKNLNLKLNIKERDEVKGLQHGIVRALMDHTINDRDRVEDDDGIVFSRQREEEGKISSYAFVNNRVILGSGYGLVKEARKATIDMKDNTRQRISLLKFLKNADGKEDGYIFVDNKDGYLANQAEKRGSRLRIPILVSGASIDSVGAFFDFVDRDSIKVRIVAQAKDPAAVDTIEVDARFLTEFYRRKLMTEKIDCVYSIEKKEDSVVVNMDIKNIEPFLKKILKVDTLTEVEKKDTAGVKK